MSFSSEIKQELSAHVPPARHCRLAEMAAILNFCSRVESVEGESPCVKMHTENLAVARKYFTLLRKTFNIRAEVSVRKSREVRFYSVIVSKDPEARRLLGETCLLDEDGNVSECMSPMHHRLLRQNCCRRAFIYGEHFWQLVLSVIRRNPITLRLSVQHRKKRDSCRSCWLLMMWMPK